MRGGAGVANPISFINFERYRAKCLSALDIDINIDNDRFVNTPFCQEHAMTAAIQSLAPVFGMGKKKSDIVFHHLRRAILLGRLAESAPLLEQQIAEQLSCSQGTVREALMHLERQGLVERHGYRGTRVTSPRTEEVQIMVHFRIVLECDGIGRSVTGFSDDVLAELYAITERMDEATSDNDYYRSSELDREFHLRIFQQSGFTSLEPTLTRCALYIHRFTYKHAENRTPDPNFGELHRRILKSIETGNAAVAREVIENHIRGVIDVFAPDLKGFSQQ